MDLYSHQAGKLISIGHTAIISLTLMLSGFFPSPTLPLAYTPPEGYAVDFVVLSIPGRTLRVYGDGVVAGYRVGNLAPWQDPTQPVTVEQADEQAPELLSVEFALVELPPWCPPPPAGSGSWVCIDGQAVVIRKVYLPLVKN